MEYSTTKAGQTVTIKISGELDAVTVVDLRPEIERIIAERVDKVIVELSALRLIDSSGVGAIVSLFKRLRAEGGQFEVAGVQGQPLMIFQVLKLDQVFAPR